MKTKKELLKFFLEKLELWNAFSAEVEKLHIYHDAPEWDCIDNDLNFLFNAVALTDSNNKEIRVANRLKDNTYLDQLINNEDLGQWTLLFAITDLCEYAGLDSREPKVFEDLPAQASIYVIVERVYKVARLKGA